MPVRPQNTATWGLNTFVITVDLIYVPPPRLIVTIHGGAFHHICYSCGLSTATVEYSSLCGCVSLCVSVSTTTHRIINLET